MRQLRLTCFVLSYKARHIMVVDSTIISFDGWTYRTLLQYSAVDVPTLSYRFSIGIQAWHTGQLLEWNLKCLLFTKKKKMSWCKNHQLLEVHIQLYDIKLHEVICGHIWQYTRQRRVHQSQLHMILSTGDVVQNIVTSVSPEKLK